MSGYHKVYYPFSHIGAGVGLSHCWVEFRLKKLNIMVKISQQTNWLAQKRGYGG